MTLFPVAFALANVAVAGSDEATAQPLRVSKDRRFLVTAEGKPSFWLGDTAWELFHRLNREEAIAFLDDRAAMGFTAIQAVLLAEVDGLNTPNAWRLSEKSVGRVFLNPPSP